MRRWEFRAGVGHRNERLGGLGDSLLEEALLKNILLIQFVSLE